MSMTTGIWNCEYGHEPETHSRRIMFWFEEQEFKVLCLTEARDYLQVLDRMAKARGHKLLYLRTKPGSDQCAILVHHSLTTEVERVWSITAGGGWKRATGGIMQPMQPLCAVIDDDLYVSAHAPVGAWVVRPRGRAWIGAPMRRLAYRGFVVRLRRLAKRHTHHRVTIWCDWNASPLTRGRWSPEWLRNEINGRFLRPHENTGHGEIDFAISTDRRSYKVTAENPPMWPGDHLSVRAEGV